MTQFFDANIEKIVLSFLLKDIKYIDEFIKDGVDASCFYSKEGQSLTSFILNQYQTFHSILSRYTLERVLLNTPTFTDDDRIALLLFYDQVAVFNQTNLIHDNEFPFYFNELKEARLKQRVLTVLSETADQLKLPNKSGRDVLSFITNKILDTEMPGQDSVIRRCVIHDVEPRQRLYLAKKLRPEQFWGIPYGMKVLDAETHGLRKSHLAVTIGFLGKGKSRFLLNVGYNASIAGYVVLYITIEMAADEIEYLIDSRESFLSFDGITYAELTERDEQLYFESLKRIKEKQYPFYIVDIPEGCTAANVKNEIFLFKKRTGRAPDLVIVDYGNLMSPVEKGYSEPQNQGNVFKELKKLARREEVAVLTAAQQNREGERILAAGKSGDELNLNIALSNMIAAHSNVVYFLKRDAIDDVNHQLHVFCTKNRYGRKFATALYIDFDYNYIGDTVIPWSNRELKVMVPQTEMPASSSEPSAFFTGKEF